MIILDRSGCVMDIELSDGVYALVFTADSARLSRRQCRFLGAAGPQTPGVWG